MAYTRNPRKRVVRGPSQDELRSAGRRLSEELNPDEMDMPFVRLGSSVVGTGQDVVQRIGNAIIGGDFGGNARGEGAIDIQIERLDSLGDVDVTLVASGVDSIAFGRNSRASGLRSVAIGRSALADDQYAIALGKGAALADGSIAIGGVVTQGGDYGITFGGQATVTAQQGVAIGEIADATAFGAVAIGGQEAHASGAGAVAIGTEVYGSAAWSVAIGASAVASELGAIAIGRGAVSSVVDQAVIAATALKMQTAFSPSYVYESIITTSATSPVTGNVATWADVDRIGDGGVALSALAPLASPTFTGVVTIPNTGLHLLDTNASHDLIIAPGSDLTADRTLTLTTGDADRTVTLSGNLTVDGATTITAAAATVLDDATVGAMVNTLGGASSSGSGGLARVTSPVFATDITTPAIKTASGALTVTPAAGSGVTVVVNGAPLLVSATTGAAGVVLFQATASEGGLFRVVDNATSGFLPTFEFLSEGVNGIGGGFLGRIPAANDVLSASLGAFTLDARQGASGVTALTAAHLFVLRNGATAQMVVSVAGNLLLGTTVDDGTNIIGLGGNAARSVGMRRHTTANTAGNSLTIQAGGATSGATDKAGGDLLLQPGASTGSAESGVQIYGVVAGASGTADRTQTKAIQVLGNKLGFFNVTPVVRPTALTAALTALTHTAPGTPDYALQNLTAGGFGFATADEGNTALSVLVRTAARVGELETKLQALGLLT